KAISMRKLRNHITITLTLSNLKLLIRINTTDNFFNSTATPELYTLSLHDALPISSRSGVSAGRWARGWRSGARSQCSRPARSTRSEEHTSELQSRGHLVCRLLLEKKKRSRIRRVLTHTNV